MPSMPAVSRDSVSSVPAYMQLIYTECTATGVVAGAEQRSGASAAPQQPSAQGTSGAPQAEVTGPPASALPPSAASAPPQSSTTQVCMVLL